MGKIEEEALPKPLPKKAQLANHLKGLAVNTTGTLAELAEMLGCKPQTVRNALEEIGGGGDIISYEGGRWIVINPEAIIVPGQMESHVVLSAQRFRPLDNTANSAPGGASHSGPSKSTPATSGEHH